MVTVGAFVLTVGEGLGMGVDGGSVGVVSGRLREGVKDGKVDGVLVGECDGAEEGLFDGMAVGLFDTQVVGIGVAAGGMIGAFAVGKLVGASVNKVGDNEGVVDGGDGHNSSRGPDSSLYRNKCMVKKICFRK
jgi:hypothetical protein